MTQKLFLSLFSIFLFLNGYAKNREIMPLDKEWLFQKKDITEPIQIYTSWDTVNIPHDWAINGPFDLNQDMQFVQVIEDGDKEAKLRTGRTGALPATGMGQYRKELFLPVEKSTQRVYIEFDGVMSNAKIYLNGEYIGERPYGYSSFSFDLTDHFKFGKKNILDVTVENKPEMSRFYTGAGIYRPVRLICTSPIHVAHWGTFICTPEISTKKGSVSIKTNINAFTEKKGKIKLITEIYDPSGKCVSSVSSSKDIMSTLLFEQNCTVKKPALWDTEHPHLYTAVSKVYFNGEQTDIYKTTFGFRTIKFDKDKGFFLNEKATKIKGVCLHHDLGPLGAAVNLRATERQLEIMKEMGCNAIRTSHNPPSIELLELCDKMGLMVQVEAFDEWKNGKCVNGYNTLFDKWAEKDLTDLIRRDRNHPCVIMWSIGNEVPTQCSPVGYKVAKFLQDICHREDPTRPVTCGMDQVSCVLANGFAAMIDIPGLNYRTQRYQESYDQLPQNLILGSETASTVSSRGVYKFPVEDKKGAKYEDHQCSSYDVEVCPWSNIPDEDFALADDHHWTIGQFVWTGFDYLGEPSPYDTDSWPNHSSMFGIIDLASLPKDRYYLYRSVWNKEAETLHILPHWTWPGREGEVTPIFVYTNYPTAELFINGKSYGKQSKNNSSLKNRYRLMWMDTKYEPGEVKVVAYDKNGKAVAEKVVRTAGKPHHIELVSNRNELTADGKDLAYVTVKVVDKDGNLCPADNRQINFSVKGTGKYRAAANGDPTNLEQFHLPKMHAFNGMLTAILQAGETAGEIVFTVKANGVKAGNIRIQTK